MAVPSLDGDQMSPRRGDEKIFALVVSTALCLSTGCGGQGLRRRAQGLSVTRLSFNRQILNPKAQSLKPNTAILNPYTLSSRP